MSIVTWILDAVLFNANPIHTVICGDDLKLLEFKRCIIIEFFCPLVMKRDFKRQGSTPDNELEKILKERNLALADCLLTTERSEHDLDQTQPSSTPPSSTVPGRSKHHLVQNKLSSTGRSSFGRCMLCGF